MKKKKRKVSTNLKVALFIVLTYVLLATIYSFCSFQFQFNIRILRYLFIPAGYFPSIIFEAEREPWFSIIVCQLITLMILWPLCWLTIILIKQDKTANA